VATLDEILARGDRKYGKGTYLTGFTRGHDYPRIPTGIFSLDYAIGGGFPVGVTSSPYGPPGGGKTLVLTRACAGAQSICWKCFQYLWDCKCAKKDSRKVVWVSTELFDIAWARMLGVDSSKEKFAVAEPDTGEQAADIIAECLRADDVGLVVLDSLAMLTPQAELDASAADDMVAVQARLIARMIRRIKTILIQEKKRDHKVAFIATNQVRAKIGGFGRGPQEEVPGGFVSKHDWHLTFRMSQVKSEDIDKETELPVNARFKASMAAMGNKRKIFTLSGAAEFYATVSDGGELVKGSINDYRTAFRYAETAGLIGRDPWSFRGETFRLKSDIMESWYDNEKFLSAKKFIIDHYIQKAKENEEQES